MTTLLGVLTSGLMAQVNITIDVNDHGCNISPTHYGIFFEDINHAADGGLYAELIRNRSFEENNSMPQAWDKVGGSIISLTKEGLLNDKQGHALKVEVGKANGGVQNEGFWGIHAVNGTQYRLSFWVRVQEGKPGALHAALVDGEGKRLAETKITDKLGKKWQKVEATMVAHADDPKAHFELTAENPCKFVLDVVSLFPPTFKNRPNGCRPQLAQMLADMHPKFMRFPGGCYVEGQEAPENAFRWERTVGPIEQRPGHYDANWRYWTTDGLGFHEFLQLAEDLGAKPLYVVNVGIWHGGFTPVEELDGWIQECMDALEYANGPVTSKYGKMRAENGHPEPFNIEYLEIGNENANFHFDNNSDQSERYFERYRKFYDAVKATYPNIKCIGNVESWGTDRPSWRSKEPVDMLDEHYYRNPSWFADAYHKYDNYDRKGPRIYVGEYAVTSQYGKVGNMNAALGEAVYMLGMENNSEVVVMNSYAPIFVNENASNWPTDMIHFNSSEAFGTPSYWVQQLFPTHVGNRLVNQKMEWSLPEPKANSVVGKPVRVGVSTWNTQSTYKDAELFVDGIKVDLPSITEWESQLKTPGQRPGGPRRIKAKMEWTIDNEEQNVTKLGNGEGRKWMCPVELMGKKYTYKVKAKKNGGAEGFLLVYNYQNEENFDWFNIGGWGNTKNAIEQGVEGGRLTLTGDAPFRVENDRWYSIQVDVEGDSVAAYVDGKLQFTARHRSADMRGVYSNSTLDEKSNTLYIKVVNVGEGETDGQVCLTGGKADTAEMIRLAGVSGQDENSMSHPLNIIPRPAKVDVNRDGSQLSFKVAPYSVNIITVKLK